MLLPGAGPPPPSIAIVAKPKQVVAAPPPPPPPPLAPPSTGSVTANALLAAAGKLKSTARKATQHTDSSSSLHTKKRESADPSKPASGTLSSTAASAGSLQAALAEATAARKARADKVPDHISPVQHSSAGGAPHSKPLSAGGKSNGAKADSNSPIVPVSLNRSESYRKPPATQQPSPLQAGVAAAAPAWMAQPEMPSSAYRGSASIGGDRSGSGVQPSFSRAASLHVSRSAGGVSAPEPSLSPKGMHLQQRQCQQPTMQVPHPEQQQQMQMQAQANASSSAFAGSFTSNASISMQRSSTIQATCSGGGPPRHTAPPPNLANRSTSMASAQAVSMPAYQSTLQPVPAHQQNHQQAHLQVKRQQQPVASQPSGARVSAAHFSPLVGGPAILASAAASQPCADQQLQQLRASMQSNPAQALATMHYQQAPPAALQKTKSFAPMSHKMVIPEAPPKVAEPQPYFSPLQAGLNRILQ